MYYMYKCRWVHENKSRVVQTFNYYILTTYNCVLLLTVLVFAPCDYKTICFENFSKLKKKSSEKVSIYISLTIWVLLNVPVFLSNRPGRVLLLKKINIYCSIV